VTSPVAAPTEAPVAAPVAGPTNTPGPTVGCLPKGAPCGPGIEGTCCNGCKGNGSCR
jgi:hypothetical protein